MRIRIILTGGSNHINPDPHKIQQNVKYQREKLVNNSSDDWIPELEDKNWVIEHFFLLI